MHVDVYVRIHTHIFFLRKAKGGVTGHSIPEPRHKAGYESTYSSPKKEPKELTQPDNNRHRHVTRTFACYSLTQPDLTIKLNLPQLLTYPRRSS